MFDRLQRPFLTVETGEAYQPVRLTYRLMQKEKLIEILKNLTCVQENTRTHSWNWYWNGENDTLHFESIDAFKKNITHPVRLATLSIREDKFYINLPSFKRACLAVPFFHKIIPDEVASIQMADFINNVFALDERLPHGFTELFKEEELDMIMEQRVTDYHKVKEQCEHAASAEEAFALLSGYTKAEAQKRLPYAERYVFEAAEGQESEVVFLAFYIFLRAREMVAIKRWFGQSGYSLADAADDTVEQVFGGMDIDILD